MVAVAFDFAGGQVDVAGSWLLFFVGLCLFLAIGPIYFNRSVNHEGDYIDERWGYGSIDDDDWGLAISDARASSQRTLRDLAERSDAR